MKAYVIQCTEGGIPDDPEVFTDKGAADRAWLGKFIELSNHNECFDFMGEPFPRIEEDVLTSDYFSPDAEGNVEWRRYEVEVSA